MASLGTTLPLWRRLAPRLANDVFTCRQCLRNQSIRRFGAMPSRQPTKTQSTLLSNKNRQFFTSSIQRSAAAQAAAEAIQGGAEGAKRSFPKISDKAVAYWLLGSAASVFGIVVFGGLTRLTESGCVYVTWDAK